MCQAFLHTGVFLLVRKAIQYLYMSEKEVAEKERAQQGESASPIEAREQWVLSFWKERTIFQKSIEKDAPKGDYVFFEGPPTANGRPGVHHLESRAFKDVLPRYKTMRGYKVRRRAGWDTHGLPVELEVEKQLGFSGKKDIETYGIAAFNAKCRESVGTYIEEWQRFTNRIGYWINQDDAYFTYNPEYMESVWSLMAGIAKDDRLYKDYKVLPWCSRCGTALSSHELAQGYEDVKDLCVTVKFALVDEPGTYVLAWTTTPWTLPGNVALAVGTGISYGRYTRDGETVIVATERASVLGEGWACVETFPGSALIGKAYVPLYPYAQALANETEQPKFAATAFRIHAADFVTTEDGTGVVHTAVMYGTDDFELGNAIGLPKVHVVGADGKFLPGTEFLEGRFVKEQDAAGKPTLAVDIIDDLKKRNLFFSQENYKHSYPFCWRCKTPLIYFARDSWFIRMHDLREQLVAENKKIHWEPEYIRDGRMGEWLSGAKEWAVSRERYWGTPLPVWQNEDGSERLIIDSIETLKQRTKRSGNTYYAMRHGEAEQNVLGLVSSGPDDAYHLTEKGQQQVRDAAKKVGDAEITRIYTSPVLRALETAQTMQQELGLPDSAIVVDERLRELDFGDLSGGTYDAFVAYDATHMRTFTDRLPGGESYQDTVRRFGSFLYELENAVQNETVLIVSHGIALESFSIITTGANAVDAMEMIETFDPPHAQPQLLDFIPLPHDENYTLDLHRPYIDAVELLGDSGAVLRRVPDVMDVWFDSGAMPFAQDHYPFENKEWIEGSGYPADFISEAIDQTRGWFYTLLALGVLSGRGTPYKAVICLGHLLDAQGLKMSKSRGNGISAWDALRDWGADTLRFWMYSVNQPGDSKNFDPKTVKEAARVLSWLENSVKFYELFKDTATDRSQADDHTALAPLDAWILARTNETLRSVTEAMEALKPYDATRSLAGLFEDLSQWYVRRVRDRARDGDAAALSTLRHVLFTSAHMLAPFSPFIAEDIFQTLRSVEDGESVHLAKWPEVTDGAEDTQTTNNLIVAMKQLRTEASAALMMRQKAGIPVRQPLAQLTISNPIPESLWYLLMEEVNVEAIVLGDTLALDTVLTPALIQKGDARAYARAVAEARKALGFTPQDVVQPYVQRIRSEVGDAADGVFGEFFGARAAQFSDVALQATYPYSAVLSTGTVSFTVERVGNV